MKGSAKTIPSYLFKQLSSISELEQPLIGEDEKSGNHGDNIIQGEEDGTDTFTSCNAKEKWKPKQANSTKWEAIRARVEKTEVLPIEHFDIKKDIGEGCVGNICLCRLSDTPYYFVLKTMNRVILQRLNKLKSIQNEIEILEMLDHPFLPNLYHSFQMGACTFIVMDYCPGGDLYGLQRKQPGNFFSEGDA
ncbi:hypothetical protein KI387_025833, partial [Taxus chinensis]